jgi:hypothetical protein
MLASRSEGEPAETNSKRGEVALVPPRVLDGEARLADSARPAYSLRLNNGRRTVLAELLVEPFKIVLAAFQQIAQWREREVVRWTCRAHQPGDQLAQVEQVLALAFFRRCIQRLVRVPHRLVAGHALRAGQRVRPVECPAQRDPED